MRSGTLLFLGCLVLSGSVIAGELRIDYDYAGLTKIHVTEHKQLVIKWHTRRLPFENGDISPMRQSLDAYDSHSSVIWLTRVELNEFEHWIEETDVFNLPSTYPVPEEQTYGSAFRSTLTVELDGRNHSLEWTGDTTIPYHMYAAVNSLVEKCHEIRRSREEK